jgi:hypothetical protein
LPRPALAALHPIKFTLAWLAEGSIGWSNPTGYAEMADLVMQYLGAPGMQKPEPDATYTNRFTGKSKLQVDSRVAEFGKYIG